MTEHPLPHGDALELLAGYIDGTLDDDAAAAMAAHVEACPACSGIVGDDGPTTSWPFDETIMRRSVRRTLLRTAASSAGIVVTLLVLVALGSTLLVQPLFMNLGDRAEEAAHATHWLPSLVNEGVVVGGFTITSGVADRHMDADLRLPVGSALLDAGTVETRVTLGGIDGTIWPFADELEPNPVAAREVLERLGRTAVATVAVPFDDGITLDAAEAIAADPGADVAIVWAGFIMPGSEVTDPLRILGAPTCAPDRIPEGLFGASSASAGGTFGETPASVTEALAIVRSVVADVASSDEVLAALPIGWGDRMADIADDLESATPTVGSLVVTGPAEEVLAFLDTVDTMDGRILDSTTFNWLGSPCR